MESLTFVTQQQTIEFREEKNFKDIEFTTEAKLRSFARNEIWDSIAQGTTLPQAAEYQ